MAITHHSSEERELARLHAALAAVTLTDSDRRILHWIAGWGPEVADPIASLLERTALAHGAAWTAPAGEPAAVRAAYDDGGPIPEGADPRAAEGLPSHMLLGVTAGPPAEPWWRCTLCRVTRRGQANPTMARVDAELHVARHHGGSR
ncbi:hypothetical protein [Nocardiopsis composta]|uniref:Uncharacterized protein n=2 Tax=Nocardiopsis composta TaxID=157465 RepID=A0A7W8QJ15_9ACTN|nr:hypothetical protein [Nocardiopsis composta]MBB5431398.1 hypothetical protein [Nocardiopsis composta]